MIEIIVIAVFAFIIIQKVKKERKDPNYRSWMDNGDDSHRGQNGLGVVRLIREVSLRNVQNLYYLLKKQLDETHLTAFTILFVFFVGDLHRFTNL